MYVLVAHLVSIAGMLHNTILSSRPKQQQQQQKTNPKEQEAATISELVKTMKTLLPTSRPQSSSKASPSTLQPLSLAQEVRVLM
jgi:hypothetical protein